MKLKKFEICLIAAAVIIMSFCAGYFTGRNDPKRVVSVETGGITVSTAKNDGKQSRKTLDESEIASVSDKKNDIQKYPLNINTASKDELSALPGIGDVLAERIIEYRKENGDFSDASQILEVYGIGDSKYETIKDYISVN